MGRSVSYPSNVRAVCFRDVSSFGYVEDEDSGELELDVIQAQDDWEFFVEGIADEAKRRWPSLQGSDSWLDREDRVLLENDYAYIGVSEYCGLAAIWLVSRGDELRGSCYGDDVRLANLADNWTNMIAPRFEAAFGELVKIGVFSSGEAVYQRRAS